jgi:acetylornithine deacetylase
MPLGANIVSGAMDSLVGETTEFLCDLIRIPSTRGHEGPAIRLTHAVLKDHCDEAKLMQIPETLRDDPLYSWPMPDLVYHDTQNLRLVVSGSRPESSKSLLLNTHIDVVPPSTGQKDPFNPAVVNNVIYGRGACDAKGQIAVFYLLARCLEELRLRPRGPIYFDIVIEEENGGNGTLFMVRNPVSADAAIVMEPTSAQIFAATRGAVWFEIECSGKSGHSGRPGDTLSALKEAVKAMHVLEQYHDELLAGSRGKNPLFDQFEDPMPVTFGMLNGGEWPATVPAAAVLKGVFGFLPNSRVRQVQDEIKRSLFEGCGAERVRVTFNMLNNEGCEVPVDHPLPRTLQSAAKDTGQPEMISAFTAACDAWRYNNVLQIPTVVFGAGDLKYAHSGQERITIDEIINCAKTLICFIERWSGYDAR